MRARPAAIVVLLLLIGCPDTPEQAAPVGLDVGDSLASASKDAVSPPEIAPEPDIPTASCPVGPAAISPMEPGTLDALSATAAQSSGPLFFAWFRVEASGGRVELATGSTLPSFHTHKGDTIEVVITSALDAECKTLAMQVVIGNTAPTISSISISPSAAYVTQPLTCSVASGAWADPDDGDPQELSWSWRRGDALIPDAEGSTLESGFQKGDQIRCVATPSDGLVAGAATESAAVPILNSPPETISIALNCPEPGEPFHCSAQGLDADGDAVSFLFSWHTGAGDCTSAPGIQADAQAVTGAFGSTLIAPPPKGASVFCCATPRDDEGLEGSKTLSSVCMVGNHPPAVTGAIVSGANPEEPVVAGSTLLCQAEVSDQDGDILATSCIWLVEGQPVEETDCTLESGFSQGDSVCCQLVANDGSSQVTSESKVCAEVKDTPPFISALTLKPENGSHCAPIACTATATDPDGGGAQVVYSWAIDDQPVGSPDAALPGQTVRCTATPQSGGPPPVSGEAKSAEITLTNHIPTLSGVDIVADPEPAGSSSSLECIPNGWADEDGCDTPDFEFSWYVSTQVLDASGPFLDAAKTAKGDSVVCVVNPGDGYAFGAPVQSKVVLLENSAPEVTSVKVSPPVGNHNTTFTCDVAADEPDGDEVGWLYSWAVNGEVVAGFAGSAATGVPFAENGALLTCTAQPFDDEAVGDAVQSSNAAVLVNAPPKVVGVSLSPKTPDTLDDLLCSASSSDPDGDPTTLTFEWFVVGVNGPLLLENFVKPVLPNAETAHFDAIYCRATPFDGVSAGTAQTSATVLVANTPPTLDSAELDPAGGTPLTLFTCNGAGFDDVDDDPEDVVYSWTIGGVTVADNAQATLQPGLSGAQTGAVIQCTAQPFDGFDKGPAYTSNPVVLSACGAGEAGGPCDDGNACTANDTCGADACVGTQIVCDDDNPCTSDGCNPDTGCTAAPNLAGCNDGNPCTENDGCNEGQCSGVAVTCGDSNPCTQDLCTVAGCLHFPGLGPCEDGDLCTVGDSCSNGDCVAGGPKSCDDGDPCTDDACDGGCVHALNTGLCDDGNPCTTPDLCVNGACLPAGFTSCDDQNPCTADGCSPDSGCGSQPLAAGSACQDGDVCTAQDGCLAGVCQGGPPLDCDDTNPCTADTCEAGLGCLHVPQGGLCPGGVCAGGQCCTPDCGPKECGDDGCGGDCGQCVGQTECIDPPGACSGAVTDDMVLIPSGDFWMGCNAAHDTACDADEYPYHLVYLGAFEIDTLEATTAAYEECADNAICAQPGTQPSGCVWNKSGVSASPVNCVTWYDAKTFCEWSGKRLCTEAEWEKAARGTDGHVFPWGDDTASCAYAVMKEGTKVGCGTNAVWPVGLIEPGKSPYGALDMAGNVSEWTADWYYDKYYQSSPAASPPGAGFGTTRVYRGGDFEKLGPKLRTSNRFVLQPDNLTPAVGIRCCRDFP